MSKYRFILILIIVLVTLTLIFLTYREFMSSPSPVAYKVLPSVTTIDPVILASIPEKVVYIDNGDIWSIKPDGTSKTLILKDDTYKFFPLVSPNGQYIAYTFSPKNISKFSPVECNWGCYSGVRVYNTLTHTINDIIPYTNSEHLIDWSPDSKYLSVYTGFGNESALFNPKGKNIFRISSNTSPIEWVPQKGKISFIYKDNLVTANPDGSEQEVLAKSVLPSLFLDGENPNNPHTISWSQNAKYVTYYKSNGLYLLDNEKKLEKLIRNKKQYNSTFHFPLALGFTADSSGIILFDNSTNTDNTFIYSIITNSTKPIGNNNFFVNLSPNKKILYSPDFKQKGRLYNLSTGKSIACGEGFYLEDGKWSNGAYMLHQKEVWSSDSNTILGQAFDTKDGKTFTSGIQILHLPTCTAYELVSGQGIFQATWFPEK